MIFLAFTHTQMKPKLDDRISCVNKWIICGRESTQCNAMTHSDSHWAMNGGVSLIKPHKYSVLVPAKLFPNINFWMRLSHPAHGIFCPASCLRDIMIIYKKARYVYFSRLFIIQVNLFNLKVDLNFWASPWVTHIHTNSKGSTDSLNRTRSNGEEESKDRVIWQKEKNWIIFNHILNIFWTIRD